MDRRQQLFSSVQAKNLDLTRAADVSVVGAIATVRMDGIRRFKAKGVGRRFFRRANNETAVTLSGPVREEYTVMVADYEVTFDVRALALEAALSASVTASGRSNRFGGLVRARRVSPAKLVSCELVEVAIPEGYVVVAEEGAA